MFDSFTQDNRLAISRFYWFWFVRTVLKNVKKFSRIVCVSLFSYQGLLCLSLRQLVYFTSFLTACQELFLIFLKYLIFIKIKAEKEGFEPSRRVNDLLPFQGSPFGQLGYFSKLPYLLSSSDIYLCRSQRQVTLYLVCFVLSSTFLTFFQKFLFCIWQAERVGFEPTRPCGQTVFKTASLWPLRYLSI